MCIASKVVSINAFGHNFPENYPGTESATTLHFSVEVGYPFDKRFCKHLAKMVADEWIIDEGFDVNYIFAYTIDIDTEYGPQGMEDLFEKDLRR